MNVPSQRETTEDSKASKGKRKGSLVMAHDWSWLPHKSEQKTLPAAYNRPWLTHSTYTVILKSPSGRRLHFEQFKQRGDYKSGHLGRRGSYTAKDTASILS